MRDKNFNDFKMPGIIALFLLLLMFPTKAFAGTVEISKKNFPDKSFREYVSNNFDENKDGILSEAEIDEAIVVVFDFNGECKSMEGIQLLTNLINIDCKNGQSDQINVSGLQKLEKIYLTNWHTEKINASGCSSLDLIYVDDDQISNIDVSGCVALYSLHCSNNNLKELSVKDCKNLNNLICANNQLEKIELEESNLEELRLSDNKLKDLNVEKLKRLKYLYVDNNELEALNVSQNKELVTLDFSNNHIEEIDVSDCTFLSDLRCKQNQLTSLDVSNLIYLKILQCQNNRMMTLDLTNCKLLEFELNGTVIVVGVGPQNITLDKDTNGGFDFSSLPGFDLSKVTEWQYGTLEGTVFMPDDTSTQTPMYYYNCGPCNMRVNFKLIDHVHQIQMVPYLAPTCGKDGNKKHYVCTTCDKLFEDAQGQKEITDPSSVSIKKTGNHTYDNGSITRKPTCTARGEKTFVCTTCKHEKKVSVKKTSHEYQNHVEQASFKKNGKIQPTCKNCDKQKPATTVYKVKKIKLSSSRMIYDGKKKKPQVKLVDAQGNSVSTYLYSVKYANNPVKVGTYPLRITLKGLYKGEKTVSYTIQPKSTNIKIIKARQKSFSLQWTKMTAQTDGYEIQYSTSNKFTASTTKAVKIKKNTTTLKTVKKLKAKKKYYVRIRTYKKVNGKTYYSDWSKTKSVVTK